MPTLDIWGRSIPYVLVRNPRSSNVRMTLTPDGLRVSAPTHLPDAQIERAVLSKERWLLRHHDRLVPHPPSPLTDGDMLPFLGGEVELGVREAGRPGITFHPEEGRLAIATRRPDDVRDLVERAYRDAARHWFRTACAVEAIRMGVTPGTIGVRDPTTRWGSCSARGALGFSWRLMMAPLRVAEYVVVHELAHLERMDHSPAFWAIVARHRPDHAADSAWLKDHGHWLARSPGHGPRPAGP
ncbi:MAG: M48 family peptidase [Thermoleophilia bacterium]|nr:M48 family peptidase [Thermoleophilia bacterium]